MLPYQKYISEIKTLNSPHQNQIKELLKRASTQVIPIMRKRNWHVNLLTEFQPRQPNLLGLNVIHGDHCTIKIKCRKSDQSLYDYQHILGTLLHELCHLVHGPHNQAFYTLLDQLYQETESGQAPDVLGPSCGHKLSTNTHNPTNRYQARDKALAAAEKRQQINQLMSKPTRLGGKPTLNLTPQQAAAQAAQKRAQDDQTCGGVITEDPVIEEDHIKEDLPSKKKSPNQWSCKQCTYINKSTSKCNLCGTLRYSWSCSACTTKNELFKTSCSICQTPKKIENQL